MSMRFRDKAVYLASLSLFFSSLELFVPKPLPFFRLGLANIPVMMGLGLDIRSFSALLLLKAVGSSYISGTFFSVFLLMSLLQTVLSGFAMYMLYRLSKHVSRYAVSAAGAAISAVSQIFFASAYAGRGAMSFLPILLIISLPASVITAYISLKIGIPEEIPSAIKNTRNSTDIRIIVLAVIVIGAIMMTEGPAFALLSFITACILQTRSGKRIMLIPHIAMLAFMVISSVLTPNGPVLFTILGFPVTGGAIAEGIARSLRLSSAAAFSLALSSADIWGRSIVSEVLALSSAMLSSFRETEGSLLNRIESTLELKTYNKTSDRGFNITVFTLFLHSAVFMVLMFLSHINIFA